MPTTLPLREAALYVAERCGTPAAVAMGALYEAFRDHRIVPFCPRSPGLFDELGFCDWEPGAFINWHHSSILLSGVGWVEGVRVNRRDIDAWLRDEAAGPLVSTGQTRGTPGPEKGDVVGVDGVVEVEVRCEPQTATPSPQERSTSSKPRFSEAKIRALVEEAKATGGPVPAKTAIINRIINDFPEHHVPRNLVRRIHTEVFGPQRRGPRGKNSAE
jgi:hypothetical protein